MTSLHDNSVQKHEWSQASGSSDYSLPGSKTKIVDSADGKQHNNNDFFDSLSTTVMVTVMEAEHIIDSLKSFPVDQIGSSEFLNMYAYQVERLSMQAHATAQRQDGDEYIVEAILTFGKLPILVQTLLAVEAWRTFVLFPTKHESSLASRMAENGNSLRCAFTLHVECTIVGLLNLILYRKDSCQELDSETSIALTDFCARQMASLAIPLAENDMVRVQKEPESVQDYAKRLQSRTTLDGMRENCLTTEFNTAVASVSLARHLCEHFDFLPLGAQTRILDTHDFLVMIVPLIDEPPWTRRRVKQSKEEGNKTVWEKYIENQWDEINVSDLLQITKCEAQCWLAIFHLTCNNTCRERYALNSFRREQLLRLRKFLNNFMLDQLPVLADVMRYMDELSLLTVSDCSTGQGAAFLMQQVSTMRETILKDQDWDKVANDQHKLIFSRITDSKDDELRLIASIYNDDFIENVAVDNAKNSQYKNMSMPIHHITLNAEINGLLTEIVILKTKESVDPSFVETPFGKFKRTKLGMMKSSENNVAQILPNANLAAIIAFDAESDYCIKLECKDIELPSLTNESSRSRKKEWRQLGTLEKGIVLQLSFKINPDGGDASEEGTCTYVLNQAFITQPEN